jgi:hypothetical protein
MIRLVLFPIVFWLLWVNAWGSGVPAPMVYYSVNSACSWDSYWNCMYNSQIIRTPLSQGNTGANTMVNHNRSGVAYPAFVNQSELWVSAENSLDSYTMNQFSNSYGSSELKAMGNIRPQQFTWHATTASVYMQTANEYGYPYSVIQKDSQGIIHTLVMYDTLNTPGGLSIPDFYTGDIAYTYNDQLVFLVQDKLAKQTWIFSHNLLNGSTTLLLKSPQILNGIVSTGTEIYVAEAHRQALYLLDLAAQPRLLLAAGSTDPVFTTVGLLADPVSQDIYAWQGNDLLQYEWNGSTYTPNITGVVNEYSGQVTSFAIDFWNTQPVAQDTTVLLARYRKSIIVPMITELDGDDLQLEMNTNSQFNGVAHVQGKGIYIEPYFKDESGNITLTYVVKDLRGSLDTATVFVNVVENNAPQIQRVGLEQDGAFMNAVVGEEFSASFTIVDDEESPLIETFFLDYQGGFSNTQGVAFKQAYSVWQSFSVEQPYTIAGLSLYLNKIASGELSVRLLEGEGPAGVELISKYGQNIPYGEGWKFIDFDEFISLQEGQKYTIVIDGNFDNIRWGMVYDPTGGAYPHGISGYDQNIESPDSTGFDLLFQLQTQVPKPAWMQTSLVGDTLTISGTPTVTDVAFDMIILATDAFGSSYKKEVVQVMQTAQNYAPVWEDNPYFSVYPFDSLYWQPTARDPEGGDVSYGLTGVELIPVVPDSGNNSMYTDRFGQSFTCVQNMDLRGFQISMRNVYGMSMVPVTIYAGDTIIANPAEALLHTMAHVQVLPNDKVLFVLQEQISMTAGNMYTFEMELPRTVELLQASGVYTGGKFYSDARVGDPTNDVRFAIVQESSLPAWITFDGEQNATNVTMAPKANTPIGGYSILATATDAQNNSSIQLISLQVNAPYVASRFDKIRTMDNIGFSLDLRGFAANYSTQIARYQEVAGNASNPLQQSQDVYIYTSEKVGQSFVASNNGEWVALQVNGYIPENQNVIVQLYAGEDITGAPLVNDTVKTVRSEFPSILFLNTNYPLVQGQSYTWVILVPKEFYLRQSANTYSGGKSLRNSYYDEMYDFEFSILTKSALELPLWVQWEEQSKMLHVNTPANSPNKLILGITVQDSYSIAKTIYSYSILNRLPYLTGIGKSTLVLASDTTTIRYTVQDPEDMLQSTASYVLVKENGSEPAPNSVSNWGMDNMNHAIGQSFTALQSGELGAISVHIQEYHGKWEPRGIPILLKIYKGTNVYSEALTEQVVYVPDSEYGAPQSLIHLDSAIGITKDSVYTFTLQVSNENQWRIGADYSNPYALGSAVFEGEIREDMDIAFSLFMKQELPTWIENKDSAFTFMPAAGLANSEHILVTQVMDNVHKVPFTSYVQVVNEFPIITGLPSRQDIATGDTAALPFAVQGLPGAVQYQLFATRNWGQVKKDSMLLVGVNDKLSMKFPIQPQSYYDGSEYRNYPIMLGWLDVVADWDNATEIVIEMQLHDGATTLPLLRESYLVDHLENGVSSDVWRIHLPGEMHITGGELQITISANSSWQAGVNQENQEFFTTLNGTVLENRASWKLHSMGSSMDNQYPEDCAGDCTEDWLGLDTASKTIYIQGAFGENATVVLVANAGKLGTHAVIDVISNSAPKLESPDTVQIQRGITEQLVQLTAYDEGKVTYYLENGPADIEVVETTGWVHWPKELQQTGTFVLSIKLEDEQGAQTQDSLVLKMLNAAPVWEPLPSDTIAVGDAGYEKELLALDLNGDSVHYSLEQAPESLMVVGTKLVWSSSAILQGEYSIHIKAYDADGAFAVDSFTLVVQPRNEPPIFDMVSPDSIPLLAGDWVYPIRAVDPEGTDVVYSIVQGPAGVSMNGSQIQWLQEDQVQGLQSIEVKAKDADGKYATITVSLLVQPPLASINVLGLDSLWLTVGASKEIVFYTKEAAGRTVEINTAILPEWFKWTEKTVVDSQIEWRFLASPQLIHLQPGQSQSSGSILFQFNAVDSVFEFSNPYTLVFTPPSKPNFIQRGNAVRIGPTGAAGAYHLRFTKETSANDSSTILKNSAYFEKKSLAAGEYSWVVSLTNGVSDSAIISWQYDFSVTFDSLQIPANTWVMSAMPVPNESLQNQSSSESSAEETSPQTATNQVSFNELPVKIYQWDDARVEDPFFMRYYEALDLESPQWGKGCWVYSSAQTNIQLPLYTESKPVEVSLISQNEGWNLISNPLGYPVQAQAVADQLVFQGWNTQTSSYYPAEILLPGQGYWVQSAKDQVLSFDVAPWFGEIQLVKQLSKTSTTNEVQVSFRAAGMEDSYNWIGLGSELIALGEPPLSLGKGISISINNPENGMLSRDIRIAKNAIEEWKLQFHIQSAQVRVGYIRFTQVEQLEQQGYTLFLQSSKGMQQINNGMDYVIENPSENTYSVLAVPQTSKNIVQQTQIKGYHTTHKLHLQILSFTNTHSRIIITDVNGQLYHSHKLQTPNQNGIQFVELDIHSLPRGSYFAVITGANTNHSYAFTK